MGWKRDGAFESRERPRARGRAADEAGEVAGVFETKWLVFETKTEANPKPNSQSYQGFGTNETKFLLRSSGRGKTEKRKRV